MWAILMSCAAARPLAPASAAAASKVVMRFMLFPPGCIAKNSFGAELRLRSAPHRDGELHVLALPLDLHLCGRARREAGDQIEHALRIGDRAALDRNEHVAGLGAALVGRPAVPHAVDDGAVAGTELLPDG